MHFVFKLEENYYPNRASMMITTATGNDGIITQLDRNFN